MRKPRDTRECAQFVWEELVSSTNVPLRRAKVTPCTLLMRQPAAISTVPHPSRGETRMFFARPAWPTFCSTGTEPEPAPVPGSVPGATRMCRPASICAGVAAEMALPIAAQEQATSTMVVMSGEPGRGVLAGQCVPLGPYDASAGAVIV